MPDNANAIGLARLYAADVDDTAPLLTNGQYATLLAHNGDNARLAAADALEAIAVSEVLVAKKIRTQDLTTDGPAVSAELRALAQRHRELAAAGTDDGIFDVVDTLPGCRRPEHTNHEVWGL
ncbi:hypothetical protein [Phycicoccus avicenniae]|uniref:hypothetical protein n=1 Tax=Phycicoccus avicenniae TaxID=2828860 RepID=UPI003D2AA010